MKLKRLFPNLVFLVSVVMSFSAFAQLEITIGEGTVRGIPIAIVPFKVTDGTALPHELDKVVAFDLETTGRFEPVGTQNFLSFPSKPTEVRYKDWRVIGVEALVVGEIWKLAEDNYEVRFHMYDVARQREIGVGHRIANIRAEDIRVAGHIVSDYVYQAFMNRPGAFNSKIAYVSKAPGRYQLMVADWDGYGAREVYSSSLPILSPSWSPDSRKLAFVAFASQGSVVKVLDLASGSHNTIAKYRGVNAAPAWSPDGTKLAYSSSRHGSPDIFVYDVNSNQHQRLTTHYAIDTEPAWTPDGRSLLFTSSRTGKPQIYRIGLNGGSGKRITFEGKENANASYDFEGKQITMVHEGGQIAVIGTKTNRLTPLTNAKFDESPSFSPNGDMVLYVTEQGYSPAFMVASSDGRVRTRLNFVKGDVREPAWSPLRK